MAARPLTERLRRAWRELVPAPRRARAARGSVFAGAQFGRLFGDWMAPVMSPDDETKGSLRTLRGRGRDLDRNNPLARQFLDLIEILIVGKTGPQLSAQARTRDGILAKPTNKTIEAAWYRWAEGPVTYDEEHDCPGFQKLLLRTTAREGEGFVRIQRSPDLNEFGFAFEIIDPDMVNEDLSVSRRGDSNEIRQGIEFDTHGRRVAFHLRDPDGRSGFQQKSERVSAADMFQVLDPLRTGQARGITWLAPSMYALRQQGAYTDAELIAARIAASKMGFYKQSQTDPLNAPDVEAADAEDEDNTGTREGEFQTDVEPGMLSKLPPGWEFQDFDPQHPSTAYGEFTRNIVRNIACGLKAVSYESLSNDRESTNYSSSRTGLLLESAAVKSLHAFWQFRVLRRIYREWLNQALLSGALKLGSYDARPYLEVKWIPPGRDWVDPMKEVQAAVLAINNGLGSRTQYLTEKGLDRDEVFEELAQEAALAKEKKIELAPAGAKPAMAPDEPGNDDEDPPGKPKPREAVLAAINGHGAAHPNGAGR